MQNLLNQRFGRLKVIGRAKDFIETDGSHSTAWRCLCDCGNITRVRGYTLLVGKSTSCRCFQKEQARIRFSTHGMTKTRVYSIWQGIKSRVNNPNETVFRYYGGRGITMHKRWQDDFLEFLKDMGLPPTDKHSIERIDNSKGYEPRNCRWATQKEQNRNKRQNVVISFMGKTHCLSQWVEELGLNYSTTYHRLKRGWSTERALTGLEAA